MSEIGPEPQELLEHTRGLREFRDLPEIEPYDTEASALRKFSQHCAVTASILAVGAALAALLAGRAANEAIISTIQSAEKWNLYQAASTRQHIFESSSILLKYSSQQEHTQSTAGIPELNKEATKNSMEKTIEMRKAVELEHKAAEELKKHQVLALSTAGFQIGIVLASVAVLANSRWLYWQSILCGAFGVILVAFSLLNIR